MNEPFESALIELETITPLFIKGKDIDYGEGMLKGKDEKGNGCVFLIDNDKLCEYIAEKGKVEEYVKYFVRKEHEGDSVDDIKGFIDFAKIKDKIDWSKCAPDDKFNQTNLTYAGRPINTKRFFKHLESTPSPFDEQPVSPSDKPKRSLLDDYNSYKKLSLKYFLENYKIFPQKYNEIRQIAKGITYNIPDESKKEKFFVKNPLGKPFIPGSSIKGAIRNAVLWKMIADSENSPNDKKKRLNNFVGNFCKVERALNEFYKAKKIQNLSEKGGKIREAAKMIKDVLRDESMGEFKYIKQGDEINFNLVKKEMVELFKSNASNISYQKTTLNEIFNKSIPSFEKKEEHNEHWKIISDKNKSLRDFFRLIKVSDANFIGETKLKETEVDVICLKGEHEVYRNKYNTKLECISPLNKAQFRITIDCEMAKRFFGENIPSYLKDIDELLVVVNKFFKDVWCNSEEKVFKDKKSIPKEIVDNSKKIREFKVNTKEVHDFYVDQQQIADNSYLFRTGWGGGFMSKAQFLNLDDPQRKGVRDIFAKRKDNHAPKSRCVIVENGVAIEPLGWCSLKILKNANQSNINEATFKKEDTTNTSSSELSKKNSTKVYKKKSISTKQSLSNPFEGLKIVDGVVTKVRMI